MVPFTDDVSTLFRPFLHTQDMYFVFVQLLSSGSAWFAIIIIVITCLFPDVVKKVLYRHLQPTSTQKSQVMSLRLMISPFVMNNKGIQLDCFKVYVNIIVFPADVPKLLLFLRFNVAIVSQNTACSGHMMFFCSSLKLTLLGNKLW